MRAFPVRLPSGVRYWTVLDEDLAVQPRAGRPLRLTLRARGNLLALSEVLAQHALYFDGAST